MWLTDKNWCSRTGDSFAIFTSESWTRIVPRTIDYARMTIVRGNNRIMQIGVKSALYSVFMLIRAFVESSLDEEFWILTSWWIQNSFSKSPFLLSSKIGVLGVANVPNSFLSLFHFHLLWDLLFYPGVNGRCSRKKYILYTWVCVHFPLGPVWNEKRG